MEDGVKNSISHNRSQLLTSYRMRLLPQNLDKTSMNPTKLLEVQEYLQMKLAI